MSAQTSLISRKRASCARRKEPCSVTNIIYYPKYSILNRRRKDYKPISKKVELILLLILKCKPSGEISSSNDPTYEQVNCVAIIGVAPLPHPRGWVKAINYLN